MFQSLPPPTSKAQPSLSLTQAAPQKVARHVKENLAKEDAEIAALEKALGAKDKSKLPRAFEEDGLGDLLEGLDDDHGGLRARSGKRELSDGEVWLKAKRRKLQGNAGEVGFSGHAEAIRQEDEVVEIESFHEAGADEEENQFLSDAHSGSESFDGLSEEDDGSDESPRGHRSSAEPDKVTKTPRENPYVAPTTASAQVSSGKYVLPSLRQQRSTEGENMSRLRKQIQGLLNRLSEANMLSIVGDVDKLYQNNPRQHVSGTIVEVLLGLLSDPTSLQDTFIILHAGFIAALHKTVGNDFGARVVQRIGEELFQHYEAHLDGNTNDKRLVNLTSLLAELYTFQVIGSVLMYDLIRLFLARLSEMNTELLLKIIRNAGSQLRQDDPSSLKAIVQSLQNQISKTGEQAISTKIKFMMETMNSLKNNRMKTGVAASAISSEHTIRMKKMLGTYNQKHIKASEPLRISLKDLQESERRGKWWLVGSSYKDEDQYHSPQEINASTGLNENVDDTILEGDGAGDLVQLAKEQRMNTSIRQSIFIAIMSATDCDDAYLRLLKLHLKKSQELEIPKILLHCAGTEMVYNPYYTLLAKKCCSDRKLKMAFQFSLWDVFKQLDDGDEDYENDDEQNREGRLSMRAMVNLAKMFGNLIADNGLGLGVLKNLNLVYLQPRTEAFVEILLITTILQSQQFASNGARNETVILHIFSQPKEMMELASGLRFFLNKKVSSSDVVSDAHDRETVKWGCKVACSALKTLMGKMEFGA